MILLNYFTTQEDYINRMIKYTCKAALCAGVILCVSITNVDWKKNIQNRCCIIFCMPLVCDVFFLICKSFNFNVNFVNSLHKIWKAHTFNYILFKSCHSFIFLTFLFIWCNTSHNTTTCMTRQHYHWNHKLSSQSLIVSTVH